MTSEAAAAHKMYGYEALRLLFDGAVKRMEDGEHPGDVLVWLLCVGECYADLVV